jgi:hypothetical protein
VLILEVGVEKRREHDILLILEIGFDVLPPLSLEGHYDIVMILEVGVEKRREHKNIHILMLEIVFEGHYDIVMILEIGIEKRREHNIHILILEIGFDVLVPKELGGRWAGKSDHFPPIDY